MSTGNIPANIESIVNELDDINWEQVIYEAVTNSLHANATKIDIKIIHNTLDFKNTKKNIEKMIVVDNGDGFHEKNTKSFQEYGSQYKRKELKIGAKGIGRFLYLKIFDNIHIESKNKLINFSINQDIEVKALGDQYYEDTSVYFSNPKLAIRINYESLEKKIREHFIAYFRLLIKKKINIEINIYENAVQKVVIKSNEIPVFLTKTFKVNSHEFVLDYVFNNEEVSSYDGYYCADDRVVVKNSDLDSNRKFKYFGHIKILYLLSSKYFDENVNKTRDNFSINPILKRKDKLFNNTSWDDIHIALKEQIKIIAKGYGIDIDEILRKNLQQSLIEAPYLAYYMQDNEEMYDIEHLIINAKKLLEEDKEYLRDNTNKEDEEFQSKLAIVTQAELAEYIFDRQKTIDKLKKLTDEKALEKEIHDLFMKKNTHDENQNYKSNNLWMFDDRFMTYDKVFSDTEIRKIFPELAEKMERPDLLSIVSNTYDEEQITDIVVIELKRPHKDITPAGAEEQLLKYARYINQSRQNNKIRIWTYAFLDFNDEVEESLNDKAYNRIFTQNKHSIYYASPGKNNIIINFMDYKALAQDADLRNKTFIKILSGQTLFDNQEKEDNTNVN